MIIVFTHFFVIINFIFIYNNLIIILTQDFLGKSDPYLELARSKEDGTFVVVHRTEVSFNNDNLCVTHLPKIPTKK